MTLYFRHAVVPTCVVLWALVACETSAAVPQSGSSAAIAATATVVYPFGMIGSSERADTYLLYHPADARVIIKRSFAARSSAVSADRKPISTIPVTSVFPPDTITVIYTEN
jgi:hypothetical protein